MEWIKKNHDSKLSNLNYFVYLNNKFTPDLYSYMLSKKDYTYTHLSG